MSPVHLLHARYETQRAHQTAMCLVETGGPSIDCYCGIAKQLAFATILDPKVRSFPDDIRVQLAASLQETVDATCSK